MRHLVQLLNIYNENLTRKNIYTGPSDEPVLVCTIISFIIPRNDDSKITLKKFDEPPIPMKIITEADIIYKRTTIFGFFLRKS